MPDWSELNIQAGLIPLLFTCIVLLLLRQRTSGEATHKVSPSNLPKTHRTERNPGEWQPDTTYRMPTISAHPCASLDELTPIPYRPFKWGPDYHITMNIRNLPFDEWIELDRQFPTYHRIKSHRIQTRGKDAIQVLKDKSGVVSVRSGRLAAVELVHELSEYLHRRYPTVFSIIRSSERSPIQTISILPLGKSYDLPSPLVVQNGVVQDVSQEDAERAMEISALLVQDDFALMVEGTDGKYYFQSGAICVPGFWRMKDKIGLPLDEIHTSGNVPQYREKLHLSMERYFQRLPVDKPVIRNNYFIQVVQPEDSIRRKTASTEVTDLAANDLIDPEELGWSYTTNGPEDLYQNGLHARPSADPDVSAQTLRLRTERQTLRRLPLSGAIVFGIRTYLFRMEDIAEERDSGAPGRLASAIKSWPPGVGQYKGERLYGKWLVPYLEEEQEKVDTWESSKTYPF